MDLQKTFFRNLIVKQLDLKLIKHPGKISIRVESRKGDISQDFRGGGRVESFLIFFAVQREG